MSPFNYYLIAFIKKPRDSYHKCYKVVEEKEALVYCWLGNKFVWPFIMGNKN